jgi:deoxyadenosine/deoxycytidine kinase
VTDAAALEGETHKPVKHPEHEKRPLVAVVGPCASGKSLLVHALRELGYNVREVAQEHSYTPAMWQRFTQPDLLVYLDVSWKVALQRRPTDVNTDWWAEQTRRLRHARQHADLYINTDPLTPREVLDRTLAFLIDLMLQD